MTIYSQQDEEDGKSINFIKTDQEDDAIDPLLITGQDIQPSIMIDEKEGDTETILTCKVEGDTGLFG